VEKASFRVSELCRTLDVAPSGFYAWCRRPESAHAQRDRRLRMLLRASFDASKQRYGSPRVHEDLLEQQMRVSRKRVIRLMQEEGLKARIRKRFKCTTMSDHDQPVAANLLDRQFTAVAPNRRWVATRPSSSSGRAASCTSLPSSTCSHASWSAGPSVP